MAKRTVSAIATPMTGARKMMKKPKKRAKKLPARRAHRRSQKRLGSHTIRGVEYLLLAAHTFFTAVAGLGQHGAFRQIGFSQLLQRRLVSTEGWLAQYNIGRCQSS